MADADDFTLALAEVRMLFPGAAGSGMTDAVKTAWQSAYDKAKRAGLATVTITSSQFEGGGSSSGAVNFDAKILMRALIERRGELVPEFAAAVLAPSAVKVPRRQMGYLIQHTP